MAGEGYPNQDVEQSLSEHELLLRFGVSAEEASQEVSFFSYSGTLGQALADERCPVGAMIEQAHSSEGVEGVRAKLGELNGMSGGTFKVDVRDKEPADYERAITLAQTDVKKN